MCTFMMLFTLHHIAHHHMHPQIHGALPIPQLSGVGVAGHKLGGADKTKDVDDIQERLKQLHS